MKRFIFFLLFNLVGYPLLATDYSAGYSKIFSYEDTTLTGQTSFQVWYYFKDTVSFSGEPELSSEDTNLLLSHNGIPDPNYFLPGDSILVSYNLTYDTALLPFYPQGIEIKQPVFFNGATPDSAEHYIICEGKIFFTPYNTVEIWSDHDFYELPRSWKTPDSPAPQRIFIPQNQIPVSNIPDTFRVDPAWQDELQIISLPGLAYDVEMMPLHPDTLAHYSQTIGDGEDSITHNKQLPTFTGTISGRLVAFINNDLRDPPITLPLSGIMVKLKDRDLGYNEEFGKMITDENGEFTINYAMEQINEGNNVELFIKIKSKNDEYGNFLGSLKVKRTAIAGASYNIIVDIGAIPGLQEILI